MTTKQRAVRAGIAFIALLILGGIALMYKGNDALALATEKKEGILTAEQVRMRQHSSWQTSAPLIPSAGVWRKRRSKRAMS